MFDDLPHAIVTTAVLPSMIRYCSQHPIACTASAALALLLVTLLGGLPGWLATVLGSCAALPPLLGWRHCQRQLAGHDEQLRMLISSAPCAALLVGDKDEILLANARCESLFGLGAPLQPGTPLARLPAPWCDWLDSAQQSAAPVELASASFSVQGRSCQLLLVERHEDRQTPFSARTRHILQQIIDVIPQPVYIKDKAGCYTLVNAAFAAERNLQVAEMIGRNATSLQFPEAERIAPEDRDILAGTEVFKEESAIHPRTGQVIFRVVSKRRSEAEHGEPVIVGTHFDITPWRQAERELQVAYDKQKALRERTQIFIQRLIDVIPDPVYVKDADSRFLLVNKAFGRERGLPPEEIVGQTSFDLAPDMETAELVKQEDIAILAGGEVTKEQHSTHPVSGAEVFRVVSKRLCYNADNAPVIVGAHFDLTRWRIAERQLTEAMDRERAQRERVQDFMQRMIDVFPQPVYLKDDQSRYVMINEAFAQHLGLPAARIIGLTAGAWSSPEHEQEAHAEDVQILAGLSVRKEEARPHPQTGEDMFRIVTKRACLDADGKPIIVGANYDITEWRLAERDLKAILQRERELRERVQAFTQRLIDVIPQPVYVKDAASRYIMVNKAMVQEIGKPPSELIGKDPIGLGAAPEYANLVSAEDARAIAGEVIYKEEHIKHPYKGQESFRIISKGSCLDAEGQPVIVGANFDITPLRQAERQARDALEAQSHVREFLQSLISALPTPLYVEDTKGKLLMVNHAFRQLIGETRRDLIGTATIEYGPDGLRRALAYCHAQAAKLEEGHVFETEFQYLAEDGPRHYILRAVMGHGVEEQSVLVGIMSDVSVQREAEARWAQAKEDAERASQAKSIFLASMSHEIRTPLAGVIGTLELALRRSEMPPGAHDLINTGLRNAQSLLGIINDILDFSKIEAGQLRLETIDFDLRAVAVECLRILQNNAKARSLRLIIDIDPKLPAFFKGDPTRLRQILINLVGNALKFTEHGSVALRATSLGKHEGAERVRFRVEDTGIGIPSEAIPRLFGKFQQADSSTTRRYGGTGLGLAICRELVEAMGGEIGVTSKPGVGSTFEFILPLPLGEKPQVQDDTVLPPHERALNILCAEDYSTNQLIIQALLEEMGHHVELVENGRDALRALAARDFDLVLMDGRMPEMDGMEAARAVRAGGIDGQAVRDPLIPIIALTANAGTEDRQEYLAAGMNDFLTKPIELRKLHAALSRVIHGEFDSMPIAHTTSASAGSVSLKDDISRPAGITPALYGRLLNMFADSIPGRQKELNQHIETLDMPALAALAHGLRGSAGMLGALAVSDQAGRLEEAARAHNAVVALPCAHALQSELGRLFERLQADPDSLT